MKKSYGILLSLLLVFSSINVFAENFTEDSPVEMEKNNEEDSLEEDNINIEDGSNEITEEKDFIATETYIKETEDTIVPENSEVEEDIELDEEESEEEEYEEESIVFESPVLETLIVNQLIKTGIIAEGSTTVTPTEILELYSLTIETEGDIPLIGLEYATNLKYLTIRNSEYNKINVINALALESLNLHTFSLNTPVSFDNYDTLEKLSLNLEYMDILYPSLFDNLDFISNYVNLTNLNIGTVLDDEVSNHNLAFITNLTALESLGINNINFNNTLDLSNAESLNMLFIDNTDINNLDILAPNYKTKTLVFKNNSLLSDASGLINGGEHVRVLQITDSFIDNLDFITNMKQLEMAYLQNNSITNINGLAGNGQSLANIKQLYLENNKIEDASVLAQVPFTKEGTSSMRNIINLSYNYIEDIKFIENMELSDHRIIYLNNNKITDFTPYDNFVTPNNFNIYGQNQKIVLNDVLTNTPITVLDSIQTNEELHILPYHKVINDESSRGTIGVNGTNVMFENPTPLDAPNYNTFFIFNYNYGVDAIPPLSFSFTVVADVKDAIEPTFTIQKDIIEYELDSVISENDFFLDVGVKIQGDAKVVSTFENVDFTKPGTYEVVLTLATRAIGDSETVTVTILPKAIEPTFTIQKDIIEYEVDSVISENDFFLDVGVEIQGDAKVVSNFENVDFTKPGTYQIVLTLATRAIGDSETVTVTILPKATIEPSFTIDKEIIEYVEGTSVSEETFLKDIGLEIQGDAIITTNFERVDFNKSGSYFVDITLVSRALGDSKEVEVRIVPKEETDEPKEENPKDTEEDKNPEPKPETPKDSDNDKQEKPNEDNKENAKPDTNDKSTTLPSTGVNDYILLYSTLMILLGWIILNYKQKIK